MIDFIAKILITLACTYLILRYLQKQEKKKQARADMHYKMALASIEKRNKIHGRK